MKHIYKFGVGVVVVCCIVGVYAAFQFGERAPLIASGRVDLAADLQTTSAQTLFITVFDAASSMPMPYGAMRLSLGSPPIPGKTVSDFVLTPQSLQMMNPEAPLPIKLRIKARLDLDGMGGSDQPGDLVGTIEDVDASAENLVIVIDQRIP